MAFRFWRRVKIAPGITLNLSKSGASFSVGPRGAKLTAGPRGRRATVGIPGTGLFYTTTSSRTTATRRAKAASSTAAPADSTGKLTLSFFQRLVTPPEERAFVDGCRELALGHEDAAAQHLAEAAHLPDAAFLAGITALRRGQYGQAAAYLRVAANASAELGRLFDKYGISARTTMSITPQVVAVVEPDSRGALLALVEAYQADGQLEAAAAALEELLQMEPDDVVVRLSLAEVLLEAHGDDGDALKRIVRLGEGVQNESAVHAALLLYKARALRRLGLADAAREILTAALRRKKDRPADLLHALRYERALAYEDLGQQSRARADLEKLYAEDPHYADVAERLGL